MKYGGKHNIQNCSGTGVLVVCEGGDDKNLVAYITDAINGLLGVPVHKIKVMKMSE